MTDNVLQFPPAAERINRAREKEGLKESESTKDLNARIDRIKCSIARINALMSELKSFEGGSSEKRKKDSGRGVSAP